MKKIFLLCVYPLIISCLPFEPIPAEGIFLYNQCPYDIDYYIHTPNLNDTDKGYIKHKFTLQAGERTSLLSYSSYQRTDKEYTELIFLKGNTKLPHKKTINKESNVKRVYITICP